MAGIVPIGFAISLAWQQGVVMDRLTILLMGCALGSAILIQMATNFFNDVLDAERGADGQGRLGPQRVTSSGVLSKRQVMRAGLITLGLAVLAALPLVWLRGWVIVAVGLPSIYFAYGYTGGFARLAYRGLGEVFVMIFFGWVAVLTSVFIIGGTIDLAAWALATGCGAFSCVLIAINNLRDFEGDRQVGKMTPAARFGVNFGRGLVSGFVLLGYAGVMLSQRLLAGESWEWQTWLWYGLPMALSARILKGVWSEMPSQRYNLFLGLSAGQLLLVALVFALVC